MQFLRASLLFLISTFAVPLMASPVMEASDVRFLAETLGLFGDTG